jgi:hypothetical protein
MEIEGADHHTGHRSGRVLDDRPRAAQREHRSVMVAVGVEVKETVAGDAAEGH